MSVPNVNVSISQRPWSRSSLQTLESNDHVHQSIITGKQVDGIPKCEVSPADLGAPHALETVIGTTDDGEGDRDMPAGSL